MFINSLVLCLALLTPLNINTTPNELVVPYFQSESFYNKTDESLNNSQPRLGVNILNQEDTENEYFVISTMLGKVEQITDEYFIFKDYKSNQLFTFTYDRTNITKEYLEHNKEITIDIIKSLTTGIIKDIKVK